MSNNFWQDKTCLVTGATGFLGGFLVRELLNRGAEVVAMVRDHVPQAQFSDEDILSRVKIVQGAIEDDRAMTRAVNEYACDTVFHLAAQAIVGVANREPVSTFEANIQGTWVLLEACRKVDTVKRIIVASSDKAYGDHETLPYEEDFPLQGRHPYDVSKSCADLIALTYAHTYGSPVSITRCGNLFGPGDLNSNRIIPGTSIAAARGERPVIRSDGSPVRDYVYVEDIVHGYLLLAEQMDRPEVSGTAFNFGTGEPISVLDLTTRTLAAAGRPDLEPEVQGNAPGEIQAQFLSSTKAKDLLGWEPQAKLDARLEKTAMWYKENLHRF